VRGYFRDGVAFHEWPSIVVNITGTSLEASKQQFNELVVRETVNVP
jgi:hypothetical protein